MLYLRCHEAVRGHLPGPGQTAHARPGDKVEVFLATRVEECHALSLNKINALKVKTIFKKTEHYSQSFFEICHEDEVSQGPRDT